MTNANFIYQKFNYGAHKGIRPYPFHSNRLIRLLFFLLFFGLFYLILYTISYKSTTTFYKGTTQAKNKVGKDGDYPAGCRAAWTVKDFESMPTLPPPSLPPFSKLSLLISLSSFLCWHHSLMMISFLLIFSAFAIKGKTRILIVMRELYYLLFLSLFLLVFICNIIYLFLSSLPLIVSFLLILIDCWEI